VHLELLNTVFAIARLKPTDPVPGWGELFSVTRTPDELSIVCDAALVPQEVQCQRGWRALKIEGPLDFSMVGVLASLATPLARAEIPIFVISTFDTDYILVRESNLDRAVEVLESEDHAVRR